MYIWNIHIIYTLYTRIIYTLYIHIKYTYYQRKLGSNTSVLRTNRILRLEMMKGGARLRLDLDEGWCETLHYITIHNKRIDLDEGWCETLHYITIHQTAYVILLSFAAEDRKSYWSGCIQAAIVIWQQIFAIFTVVIFLLKTFFNKCFKIVFFLLWRRDPVLKLQFPTPQSLQIAL